MPLARNRRMTVCDAMMEARASTVSDFRLR